MFPGIFPDSNPFQTCVHMSLLVWFRQDSISSRILAEAALSACDRRIFSSVNLAHDVGIVTLHVSYDVASGAGLNNRQMIN